MANETLHITPNERDPFGLAGLSQPQAPRDAWPQIEAALSRQKRFRPVALWIASAATVALAVGLYWQIPSLHTQTEPGDGVAQTPPGSQDQNSPSVERDSLESLIALSRQLENSLRMARRETGSMPAQSVVYLVELEDLVAQLDEAINREPQSRELWSQRVGLLLDLNGLYHAQLRRDYSRVASL